MSRLRTRAAVRETLVAASAKLASSNVTAILARLGGRRDQLRGLPASALLSLAGVIMPALHTEGGGVLARLSLQAAERQGGFVRLA